MQELLFNVVKHAGVLQASLWIDFTDNCLKVTVADAGRGLDVAALGGSTAASTGFGLLGIRERSHSMGGALPVDCCRHPLHTRSLTLSEVSVMRPCRWRVHPGI